MAGSAHALSGSVTLADESGDDAGGRILLVESVAELLAR